MLLAMLSLNCYFEKDGLLFAAALRLLFNVPDNNAFSHHGRFIQEEKTKQKLSLRFDAFFNP